MENRLVNIEEKRMISTPLWPLLDSAYEEIASGTVYTTSTLVRLEKNNVFYLVKIQYSFHLTPEVRPVDFLHIHNKSMQKFTREVGKVQYFYQPSEKDKDPWQHSLESLYQCYADYRKGTLRYFTQSLCEEFLKLYHEGRLYNHITTVLNLTEDGKEEFTKPDRYIR